MLSQAYQSNANPLKWEKQIFIKYCLSTYGYDAHVNFISYTFAIVHKISPIARYTIILVMLGSFFVQTFSNFLIVGNYYLNRSAFAQHCENKYKPMMHCNGQCLMRKKLQQEEKKEQENPERRADSKADLVLSSKCFFATSHLIVPSGILTKRLSPRTIGRIVHRSTDVFHPPQGILFV